MPAGFKVVGDSDESESELEGLNDEVMVDLHATRSSGFMKRAASSHSFLEQRELYARRKRAEGCCGMGPVWSKRVSYSAVVAAPLITVFIIVSLLVSSLPAEKAPAPVEEAHAQPRPPVDSPEARRAALFLNSVDSVTIKNHAIYLSNESHIAGSPRDLVTAQYVKTQFERLGLKTKMIEHPVLLSNPVSRKLVARGIPTTFSGPTFEPNLDEPEVAGDPASQAGRGAEPPFNGYAHSGNISDACVVYVNYGRLEDFEHLLANNVTITGCVGLARYGKIFRGNKAKFCEQYGCVGLLLFSDPIDDGCRKGVTYPEGIWRPALSAQRGSVWTGHGDPLSPGWPSTPTAPRLDKADAYSPNIQGNQPLPMIPVMPIGWGNAQPLMAGLCTGASRTVIDSDWVGGLPATRKLTCNSSDPVLSYCFGGLASGLRLDYGLDMATETKTIYEVIGVLPGQTDSAVVIGNHRDAWTYGAVDPVSGSASVLGIAEAIGLVKQVDPKWVPRRTIIFASWDAEEYGLIGSTEWGEQFMAFAQSNIVAYINIDISTMGDTGFAARGTPNFRALAEACAEDVTDVHGNRTVLEGWKSLSTANATQTSFPPLGSGSDFDVFLQRLGVSCLDGAYVSPGPYPVYHSNYDSFNWVQKFVDPNYERHAIVSKVLGLAALRLADNEKLPHDWTGYADALNDAIDELPNATLSLTNLRNATAELRANAVKLYDRLNQIKSWDVEMETLNRRLFTAERAFLREGGLPERPFVRHSAWAPSSINSYEGGAFTSITDALVKSGAAAAQFQVDLVAVNVQAVAQVLAGW